MKNEKTSTKVAAIAGNILRRTIGLRSGAIFWTGGGVFSAICSLAKLKALAASALTQTADKAKKK